MYSCGYLYTARSSLLFLLAVVFSCTEYLCSNTHIYIYPSILSRTVSSELSADSAILWYASS